MKLTRRAALQTGLAATVFASQAARQGHAQGALQEDDALLFLENAEPRPDTMVLERALNDWPLWWKQEDKPLAQWAPGGSAVDARHVPMPPAQGEFSLTAETLKRALALADIETGPLGERVLFGIRAARLTSRDHLTDGRAFQAELALTENTPDHFSPGCVLGVWNTVEDTLWACDGSTVPDVAYLYGQAQAKGNDTLCNMVAAGVYNYVVGTHRNGAFTRQPGAFILDSSVAILRNYKTDPLGFSADGEWRFRTKYVRDNIHADLGGYVSDGAPDYNSAGCQVVPGSYNPIDRPSVTDPTGYRANPTGQWREFRIAAGLRPAPEILVPNSDKPRIITTTEDGARYKYILLSAREVAAAALYPSAPGEFRKLRRGSSGEAVKRLQRALGVGEDGDFGPGTQRALIQHQQIFAGWADGVMTPDRELEFGLPGVFI